MEKWREAGAFDLGRNPGFVASRRLGLFRHFAKLRVGFVSPNGIRRSACGVRGVIAAWHLDRCLQFRREGADRTALSAQIFRFVSFAVRSPRGRWPGSRASRPCFLACARSPKWCGDAGESFTGIDRVEIFTRSSFPQNGVEARAPPTQRNRLTAYSYYTCKIL